MYACSYDTVQTSVGWGSESESVAIWYEFDVGARIANNDLPTRFIFSEAVTFYMDSKWTGMISMFEEEKIVISLLILKEIYQKWVYSAKF